MNPLLMILKKVEVKWILILVMWLGVRFLMETFGKSLFTMTMKLII